MHPTRPTHVRALTRLAAIYYRRAEYPKALEYARRALDFVMYDPDANYFYGLISRRLDDLTDAKETLGWAARSMKYRSSAYCELAEIYLMEGNFERAEHYSRQSLDYDAHSVKTLQVLSTIYRRMGQPEQARAILARILDIDPLSHFARFETYLLQPDASTLKQLPLDDSQRNAARNVPGDRVLLQQSRAGRRCTATARSCAGPG